MVKIHHPRPDRIHLHQSEGPPSSTNNRWSRPHRCWVGIQHNTRSFARHQGSPTTSPKQLKWRKKSLVSAKRDGNKQTNKQTNKQKMWDLWSGFSPNFEEPPHQKTHFPLKPLELTTQNPSDANLIKSILAWPNTIESIVPTTCDV